MTWQKELNTALRTTHDIKSFFGSDFPEVAYPILLPRKFADAIKEAGPNSPIWKQFLPHHNENAQEGLDDPIGDEDYAKAPQLIHRYKNRALFFPTQTCPIICRYCFRKNELSTQNKIFSPDFQKTLDYLNCHPEIEEIIFSGGDPLILSDEKIKYYLDQFAKHTEIKFIRFHTRTPIVLPSRITKSLIDTLLEAQNSFHQLNIVIHVNHLSELTPETRWALANLKQSGLNLLSQTVLLKEVNDSSLALKELFIELTNYKVRPYYLHHPDQVKGGYHFYLSLPKGRRIYAELRDLMPGWAIPQYVIDIPGGEGKVSAFNPEGFEYNGKLINRKAQLVSVPFSGHN